MKTPICNIIIILIIVFNKTYTCECGGLTNNTFLITELYKQIKLGLEFVDLHHYNFNLDGLIGIIITKGQLNFAKKSKAISSLVSKCQDILLKTKPLLPKRTEKDKIFLEILLRDDFWYFSEKFYNETLFTNLGIYQNWSRDSKYLGKNAEYKGVKTDICLQEILESKSCKVSHVCMVIMFGNRVDTGYLLTHRLLYLNLGIKMNCFREQKNVENLKRTFCSLMFKEAMTNDYLGFPRHDIFLEQVVFCGLNGFGEFLNLSWTQKIMNWQLEEGCFKPNATILKKRTSNLIEYGCSNHATGLGIAAMALNLRKLCEIEK